MDEIKRLIVRNYCSVEGLFLKNHFLQRIGGLPDLRHLYELNFYIYHSPTKPKYLFC